MAWVELQVNIQAQCVMIECGALKFGIPIMLQVQRLLDNVSQRAWYWINAGLKS